MNTLRCARDVSKSLIDDSNYDNLTTYIAESLSRELTNRLMTVINSGDPYAIKLEKVKTIDIPENYSVQYRQDLKIQRMIFCENCSKRKRNGFCLEHMQYEADGGYCSRAKSKEEGE